MKEIWKDIKNYEGMYQVSNLGNVKSLDKILTIKHKSGKNISFLKKGKIMKSTDNGNGYLIVGLSNKNKRINHYVHRLVAEAFIPNIENKPCVNHINGIKNDNRIENLEFCTVSENQIHACKVLKVKYNLSGLNASREKQKKAVIMMNKKGEKIKEYNSICEAARDINVQPSCICGCCKGIYKTCKGYIWKYKY